MYQHRGAHLDHSENDLLSAGNLLYFPTAGMSFQKTALRKGNLPQTFPGPNKQYFFLMDSPPPNFSCSSQIRFIIQKSEEGHKNAQKQSLFLPLLIMEKKKKQNIQMKLLHSNFASGVSRAPAAGLPRPGRSRPLRSREGWLRSTPESAVAAL